MTLVAVASARLLACASLLIAVPGIAEDWITVPDVDTVWPTSGDAPCRIKIVGGIPNVDCPLPKLTLDPRPALTPTPLAAPAPSRQELTDKARAVNLLQPDQLGRDEITIAYWGRLNTEVLGQILTALSCKDGRRVIKRFRLNSYDNTAVLTETVRGDLCGVILDFGGDSTVPEVMRTARYLMTVGSPSLGRDPNDPFVFALPRSMRAAAFSLPVVIGDADNARAILILPITQFDGVEIAVEDFVTPFQELRAPSKGISVLRDVGYGYGMRVHLIASIQSRAMIAALKGESRP